MIVEVALIVLLALLNGFFALSEMALLTSRRSRLKHLARSSRRAQIALKLAQTPERFLATVQVFITLIGIGTGTALGARLGADFARLLDATRLAWLAPYAPALGVALSVSAITFANMLLGELVPKRVALVNPERYAVATAVPMRILTWLAAPFGFVLIWLTRAILHALRMDRIRADQVSEEEIRLLVAESADQGVIDADERNMVNRVLRLGDRSVDSLMTPRPRIAWLDASASLEENLAVMRDTPYSRYPVYRGSDKDVLGVLSLKRLPAMLGNARIDLFAKLATPLYVPGTARALDLLEEFRDAETRLALVVDEYGDIEGLVTLNDVLGAVVGQGAAPAPATQGPQIAQRSDGSWLIDGALGTDDLRELLGLAELPAEDEHDFNTVAGMVVAQFSRIPHPGEHFDWRGWRFEVVDLDGARVDKILVLRVPPDSEGVESG
ncbi:MAG: HlyC/CorC family transporter [Xanthomonadaceae bacterium]|nr:HlyC/CorC family transporter [Xanthomonadaceae bacterium]